MAEERGEHSYLDGTRDEAHAERRDRHAATSDRSAHAVLELQRSAGNRAIAAAVGAVRVSSRPPLIDLVVQRAPKGDVEERSRQSRPTDAPHGTVPIDQSGLDREAIHRIKGPRGINAEPTDWVGISPDGHVITTGSGGRAEDHGHVGDFLPRVAVSDTARRLHSAGRAAIIGAGVGTFLGGAAGLIGGALGGAGGGTLLAPGVGTVGGGIAGGTAGLAAGAQVGAAAGAAVGGVVGGVWGWLTD
jgi:hypothetical protein